MFKNYYRLSKPGIVYGNLITAAGGYFFAAQLHINWLTAIGLLVGLGLVIAGACAANNVLDQSLDAKMQRTKKRALVSGTITSRQALSYSALATMAGLAVMAATQNRLTALLGALGWLAYVALYGYAKRRTVHGTLIGCISGAIPMVAGYTAVHGHLTATAWQLFVLMTAWQMGHFYGIALYRLKDYAAAGVPVMPVVYGAKTTKWQTLGYIGAFIGVAVWMYYSGSASLVVAIALGLLGISWLVVALKKFTSLTPELWGRQTFLYSLIVMLGMSLSLFANPLFAR